MKINCFVWSWTLQVRLGGILKNKGDAHSFSCFIIFCFWRSFLSIVVHWFHFVWICWSGTNQSRLFFGKQNKSQRDRQWNGVKAPKSRQGLRQGFFCTDTLFLTSKLHRDCLLISELRFNKINQMKQHLLVNGNRPKRTIIQKNWIKI